MSERQKQSDFIKQLLACDARAENQLLQARLDASEKNERCLRRACRLIFVVTLVALAALGYLTLLPLHEPNESNARIAQVLHNCFQVLALGSGMCLGIFVVLVFWQRSVTHLLYDEGRHSITTQVQNHALPAAADTFPTVVVHESDTAMRNGSVQGQSRIFAHFELTKAADDSEVKRTL